MKKTIMLLGSFLCLFACNVPAQTFTPASGYSSQAIFSTSGGQSIAGLAADSAGNLYFEVADSAGPTTVQRLARDLARPTGFAATPSTIFQYDGSPYLGFVKIYDDQLFFSEAANYTVRTLDLHGFTVPVTPLTETSLPAATSVAGLQDLAVRTSDFASGHAVNTYVSAFPSGSGNQVFKLNLTTGVKTPILDTVDDYSGPLVFDQNSRLIYGKSGADFSVPKKAGGLFVYSNTEVNGGGLTTDIAHRLVDNYSNSFFGLGSGNTLFQAESHGLGNDLLHSYNLNTGSSLLIGTANDASYDFSGLTLNAAGSMLYVALADFNNFPAPTTLYAITVPEPSAGLLACLALGGWLAVRRRRS